MNKIFDSKKVSTFRSLKDLVLGNKLVGRRKIIIEIDEIAIIELENYVYKSEAYDEIKKELKRVKVAGEYVKQLIAPRRADCSFRSNPIYVMEMHKLLSMLEQRHKK